MSMRRQLLSLLSDGNYHSGEALGAALGVSRMAVWKQVRTLREHGMPLEVMRGKGYRLPGSLELLDAEAILAGLSPATRARLARLDTFLEIDSTNTYLRKLALDGAPSGSVCLAEVQHAGRGRCNRPWVSPFAANLYLSLLWRSDAGAAGLGGLSLVIGVALLRSLRAFGIDAAGLKWPNDVLVDGAKLAGILIDVVGESSGPCSVIIGVGVNVAMPDGAASGIDQPWTDLCRLTGRGHFPRNQLAAGLLDCSFSAIAEFEQAGLEPFLDEWRRHDVINGRKIRLQLPNEWIRGRACGVDSGGALLVETDTGRRRFVSGEVSLRVAP
ncbi:MAG: bifunctional biotin--[acetyl-CoA-carboxylase] ligase/biotin operon repressor BirA [Gammaproteobacteria bacterium]|nr:bifunctional biotin--[acetyl-CoA-carboxylase] ligase/biotin operon repressor BirA [Gammaproteobacteria bacterium]